MNEDERKLVKGIWPKDCLQRAFVEGAKWAHFKETGFTMFPSERDEAEEEAIRRYGVLIQEEESS